MKRAFLAAALVAASSAASAEVVGWRGDGTGHFPDAKPPLKWSCAADGKAENVVWRTEMPSCSPASAVVVGERVFATSDDFDLVCLDRRTGRILWIRTASPYDAAVTAEERAANPDDFKELEALAAERDKLAARIVAEQAPPGAAAEKKSGNATFLVTPDGPAAKLGAEKRKIEAKMDKLLLKVNPEKYNPGEGKGYGLATQTPTSDGRLVWATNGSGVAACYDLEGNRRWTAFENSDHQHHGFHASPLLVGGGVVVFRGKYTAYDADTGRKAWEAPEDRMLRYGTPLAVKIGGADVVVTCAGALLRASDGGVVVKAEPRELWAGPVVGGGRVFLAMGRPYEGKPISWFPLPAAADAVAKPARQQPEFPTDEIGTVEWGMRAASNDIFGKSTIMSTPLYHDGLLYVLTMQGVLLVYDVEKCALVYKKLLDIGLDKARGDRPFGDGLLASAALAGGKIYIWGNLGTTLVIEPGREYREASRNRIEAVIQRDWRTTQEGAVSSPFFDGNHIYYRAERFLWCIGEPGKPFASAAKKR